MPPYRPWLTVLLAALLSFAGTSRGADTRPNILFAIADDASHFGAYGHRFVRTPHADRIAAEGIRFDFAFTPLPKCSPSRASILTGRYPWQNEEACDHYGIFPAKFQVYPDLLEAAGYHVGFTGKGWAPGDFARGGFTRNPAGPAYNQAKLKPPTSGISNTTPAILRRFLRSGRRDNPSASGMGAMSRIGPMSLGRAWPRAERSWKTRSCRHICRIRARYGMTCWIMRWRSSGSTRSWGG
jgi:hypothetical protein